MTEDSSIRTDAWEAKLSPEQRDRIFERLLQPFEPAATADWIEKEFACPRPGRSSLYRFRDRWRADYEQRRDARILLACQTTETLIAREGAVGDATRARARALALDAALKGDYESGRNWAALADRITRERGAMVDLELKTKEVEIKVQAEARAREQLAIEQKKLELRVQEAETKIAAASAALDKTRAGQLDPAALADEMDRILGRRKS